ncbi:MAG: phage tail tape measure protein [Clostridiales bacterium]|nr:phage tail tape measure protein [Clostridiales bacterium]
MANRIAGITVEIGGDTTKLSSALKDVNSEIKDTQSQLKDVNSLLKLDPTNTTLLTQKQRLLTDAISETKEKLKTLETAAEQANEALANGDITQDQYDALQREIEDTEQKLKSLAEQAAESNEALLKIGEAGEKLQSVGDAISGVGTKLTSTVTAGVVALGTAAVTTAADFESAMSSVEALLSSSSEDLDGDMEKLETAARDAGETTKFSATEAAEALYYMGLAGWDADEMVSGLPGVLNLAAAADMDLAEASDIVTDYLTAFGLSASDSADFVDLMAYAMSNSNTDVTQLGEAYKNCASTAHSLGYDVEEVTAVLMAMADAGKKGGEAGTALNAIMTRLATDTNGCAAGLAEYGVNIYDSEGNMQSLTSILQGMSSVWGTLTDEQQASMAKTIAGTSHYSALQTIMDALSVSSSDYSDQLSNIQVITTDTTAAVSDGTSKFSEYAEGLSESSGTAENMAEIMQDNLNGQLTILKSQLQELAISFGQELLPVIRDFVSWLQNLVDGFNNMDEGTRQLIIKIGLIAAAVGPVLIIIGTLISSVGTIMTSFSTLGTHILKIINYAKTGTGIFGTLSKAVAALSSPVTAVIAIIIALVAVFAVLWTTNEDFRNKVTEIWNSIKEFLSNTIEAIKNTLTSVWEGITTFISNVMTTIQTIFSTIWNAIYTVVSTIWNAIYTVISTVVNTIANVISTVFTGIYTTVEPLLTALQYLFSTVWQAIQLVVSGAMEKIQSVITSIMTAISGVFTDIWTSISTAVSDKITGIYDTVTSVFGSVVDFITGLASSAYQWGADIIDNIISGITGGIQSVADAVTGVADTIRSILGFSLPEDGPLSDADEYMPDFMQLLSEGITDGEDGVLSKVRSLASSVSGALSSGLSLPSLTQDATLAVSGRGGTGTAQSAATATTTNLGGVNITVNGYEAKDDKALANTIANKINDMILVRNAVYR